MRISNRLVKAKRFRDNAAKTEQGEKGSFFVYLARRRKPAQCPACFVRYSPGVMPAYLRKVLEK